MPFIGSPTIRTVTLNPKWFKERFQLEKHLLSATTKHISSYLTSSAVNRMPEPPGVSLLTYITPHLVQLRLFDTSFFSLDSSTRITSTSTLSGFSRCRSFCSLAWGVRVFFNSWMTVVGLMCSTRAISLTPLPLNVISTIRCLTYLLRPG